MSAAETAAPAPSLSPYRQIDRDDWARMAGGIAQPLTDNEIVLVDFWADWCGPCKRFAPIYDKASDEHGEITFAKLDTDKNGQLSVAEFRSVAPTVRPSPGGSAAILQRLDTNKDGKLTAEEFRSPILAGFDRIDTNKDGTISADERSRAEAAARTANR